MLHREYYDIRWLNWLFRLMKSIPISASNRRDIVHALQSARKELEHGQVVCIFAEGGISRIGHLLPFKRGFRKDCSGDKFSDHSRSFGPALGQHLQFQRRPLLLEVAEAPALPGNRLLSEHLSRLQPQCKQVRQAVLELESQAFDYRRATHGLLHARFIRTAKRYWSSFCMADTTGTELSFGKTLIGSMLLSRWVRKHRSNDSMVGILLPASAGGALANIAVSLAGKIPVNLNFTSGQEAMNAAIRQCSIDTILTSRVFLSKANVSEMPGMVFLEEIRKSFTSTHKLLAFISAFFVPSRMLGAPLRQKSKTQELATVIFSSGSTGTPKGVMLSHHNILGQHRKRLPGDPFQSQRQASWAFSRSFTPSVSAFRCGFLSSPALAPFTIPIRWTLKQLAKPYRSIKATILISTPTFYAGYMRRCTVEEFATLRYVDCRRGETARTRSASAFKDKYGLDLLEGYGCTELAPVVSVNLPDVVDAPEPQTGHKPGTVGHPIPGVAVRVVDPDTGHPYRPERRGCLSPEDRTSCSATSVEPELTEAGAAGWLVCHG